MIKQTKIKSQIRSLQKKLITTSHTMIQGSLVTLYRRCGNKNCHCWTKGEKHGPAYYISIPTKKGTHMHYLLPEAAQPDLLNPRLQAFHQFWELGKQLALLNLLLYSHSFKRRKKHAHRT